MNNKRRRQRKQPLMAPLLTSIFLIALLAWLVYGPKTTGINLTPEETTHNKALALGLFNAPAEIEKRHVEISEHKRQIPPGENTPVHIMYRTNSAETWRLRGTGGLLGCRPGYMLSAYHVFESAPGQYGVRIICPEEISGKQPIVPITSCEFNGNFDDTVICSVDTNRTDFPELKVPVSTNMFKDWKGDEDYESRVLPSKIHLETYPDITIQNLLTVQVRPGVYHYIFDWKVMPGESGSTAKIEDERKNVYLVIIRGMPIPAMIFNQIHPTEQPMFHWYPEKIYGVGVLVKVNP